MSRSYRPDQLYISMILLKVPTVNAIGEVGEQDEFVGVLLNAHIGFVWQNVSLWARAGCLACEPTCHRVLDRRRHIALWQSKADL